MISTGRCFGSKLTPQYPLNVVFVFWKCWRSGTGTHNKYGLDNGPEFISHKLANWAAQRHVELAFIEPGKPAQNAYIERFNRTYREDVLGAYLLDSIQEVKAITEEWLEEYNSIRPHDALGGIPPYQFKAMKP